MVFDGLGIVRNVGRAARSAVHKNQAANGRQDGRK